MASHTVRIIGSVLLAAFALSAGRTALSKPSIEILSPAADALYAGRPYIDVEALVRDQSGLKSVRIYVNGVPLQADSTRNPAVLPRYGRLQGVTAVPLSFRIPVSMLKDNRNRISLRAENVLGEIAVEPRLFRFGRTKATVFVVAIGIDQYKDSKTVRSLKYAEKDARAIAAYFRTQLGVPEKNIFTLLGQEATQRNIRKLLGVKLKNIAAYNDQIVIYYAGHGVPDYDKTATGPDEVEKYLLPWDGEIDALYATAIPMSEVDRLSRRFASQRVVFLLDTCFSGAAGDRSAGARTLGVFAGTRNLPRLDDAFLARVASATGKVMLTASGINELSQELDSLGHGVFTHYVIEGLKGKADEDENGYVSVGEVFKYVSAKVPEKTQQRQRPSLFANVGVTGDIVLGRSKTPKIVVAPPPPDPMEEGNDGRLIVLAPSGAGISIDGVARGVGSVNAMLTPGRYTVRGEKPGYRSASRSVTVSARRLTKFVIKLEPLSDFRRKPPPP